MLPLATLLYLIKELQLVDARGRIVYSENKLAAYKKQIQLTHLPKGVYFLRLFSNHNIWVKKIVVE